ncbi:hypothetical protein [Stackebrandtia soli]|uniref:hypothetical protein n=1 Tax=Stackebrandtia soli TaxID=1892856 RepID=UPI0039E9A9AF
MYSWIWRKLPFGVPGKIVGSLVLLGGVVALLWYFAFPALDPLMPFNNGTVGETEDEPGEDPGRVPSYDPDDYELEESPSEGAVDPGDGEQGD